MMLAAAPQIRMNRVHRSVLLSSLMVPLLACGDSGPGPASQAQASPAALHADSPRLESRGGQIKPVSAEMARLIQKQLSDRISYGSPMQWSRGMPRLPEDMGAYHLVELPLDNPRVSASSPTAGETWTAVIVAPKIGVAGHDDVFAPNHALFYFVRREVQNESQLPSLRFSELTVIARQGANVVPAAGYELGGVPKL